MKGRQDDLVLSPLQEEDLNELIKLTNDISAKRTLRNVLPEMKISWEREIKDIYSCPFPID